MLFTLMFKTVVANEGSDSEKSFIHNEGAESNKYTLWLVHTKKLNFYIMSLIQM